MLPGFNHLLRRLPQPGDGGLTQYGGRITPAAAQRCACDASVHRIVMGPNNVPLNLGRSVRLVSPALRRILHARDQGCRFPGCTMPPKYTDAHHLTPWSHGGPTDLDNLLLACRFHHHRVHDDNWTLRYHHRTNTVTAYRPDGTQLLLPGEEA